MGRKKVSLHEVIYERLSEAEKRLPHAPTEMLSGSTRGPVQMYVCTRVRCNHVEYRYGRYDPEEGPPVCFGGMKWSFTTSFFDPMIHRGLGDG